MEDMKLTIIIVLLFSYLLQPSSAYPLCTDSRAPFTPDSPLVFCPNNGNHVCCDSNQDLELQKSFQAMNITDLACASLLKSILCAKCDQFSAELFKTELGIRTVPVLCTVSANSSIPTGSTINFCSRIWDTCQSVLISNSPFDISLQSKAKISVNSTTSKLTDLWESKTGFCEAFGGSFDNGLVCFDENAASLSNSKALKPPNGLCLEKIDNGSFIDMEPHPDKSNRVFLANQEGKIWLATVPEQGSGGTLVLDESDPFLDITDIVHLDTSLGLMSIAFHPKFARNGRFFVSYICDRNQWSGCSGRCSCNTDVNCDPSKLRPSDGVIPCRYHTVISEFSTSNPSLGARANPLEVRRIFTMGLSNSGPHGGQILFGPDGFLYFMMGDNEDRADPYNFSQNKKSLLGKIMRFDIDNLPSAREINNLELWGNYSLPRDNPHSDDKELLPEIWAMGFQNPWRCSFDSERPSYFLCGDCGQDHYEEVDIITKGGNYGWKFYEGPDITPYTQDLPRGDKSIASMNLISPVMGYDHSNVNTNEGSASITGGYFYRSDTDPCMYGKYLYTDLYGGFIWEGTEWPENSGNFTSSKLRFTCSHDSPIQCSPPDGSPYTLGYVFSMGIDNQKDVFILTNKALLRVVRSSRCNFACSKENGTGFPASKNARRVNYPSTQSRSRYPRNNAVLFLSFVLLFIHL